ncbi:MAG TPA: hypothetical protein VLA15_11095, partial [Desulfurivibrionaceae bacterium]|nr:hypothetical protein [Desulfurivibrionaceae bacterium]
MAALFLLALTAPINCRAGTGAPAGKVPARLTALVKHGGYALTRDNRLLAGENLDLALVPAST